MRRPVSLLLGAAAFAATLAPQASANPFCAVGPVTAFGPVCTVKCVLGVGSASAEYWRLPSGSPGDRLTCLWED